MTSVEWRHEIYFEGYICQNFRHLHQFLSKIEHDTMWFSMNSTSMSQWHAVHVHTTNVFNEIQNRCAVLCCCSVHRVFISNFRFELGSIVSRSLIKHEDISMVLHWSMYGKFAFIKAAVCVRTIDRLRMNKTSKIELAPICLCGDHEWWCAIIQSEWIIIM